MKKIIVRLSLIVVLLLAPVAAFTSGTSGTSGNPEEEKMEAIPQEGMEQAVFAGGCFWGVEAVYERLDGVVDVVSGYSGGDADTAHYNIIGSGKTGHGSQYRSAVFYSDENQKRITEDVIARLDAEGVYRDPIVTEVNYLDAFYPAEPYHQNFMARNPNHPYIVYWDNPKVAQLEKTYPELLAGR